MEAHYGLRGKANEQVIYRVSIHDPSLTKRLVASIEAPDADTAINLVRDVYPWGEGFEIID